MVFTPGGHIIASIRRQGIPAEQKQKRKQYDQDENGDIHQGVMSMVMHGDLPFP